MKSAVVVAQKKFKHVEVNGLNLRSKHNTSTMKHKNTYHKLFYYKKKNKKQHKEKCKKHKKHKQWSGWSINTKCVTTMLWQLMPVVSLGMLILKIQQSTYDLCQGKPLNKRQRYISSISEGLKWKWWHFEPTSSNGQIYTVLKQVSEWIWVTGCLEPYHLSTVTS